MKKILISVALLLGAAMMLATPAFAADDVKMYELGEYGQQTVIVGDAVTVAPVCDAVINEGEYTQKVLVPFGYWSDLNSAILEEPENSKYVSQSVELYLGYDADKIYIGMVDNHFYESSASYQQRNNYWFMFGFNLGDYQEYLHIKAPGNATEFNNDEWRASAGNMYADNLGFKFIEMGTETPLVESKITFEGEKGVEAQKRIVEFSLDKAKLLAIINEYCMTDYEELPNAMYFSMKLRAYGVAEEGGAAVHQTYSMWNVSPLTIAQMEELGVTFNHVPNVIVFGNELKVPGAAADTTPADTTPADTTPADTTPADTTPADTTPADTTPADTTPADTDPVDDGGCGASVTAMGMALVATLGTCAVFVAKKKED